MKRVLIPVILSLVLLIPAVSADIDYRWEAHEDDTNPFIDPVITYQEKNVLYQDASLRFDISNSTYPDGIYKLKITNGTFDTLGDSDDYYRNRYDNGDFYRDWYEGAQNEIISENPLKYGFEFGFVLWPDLLDVDFWVEMELTITDDGQEVYREHHMIYVIGQPLVIGGSDIDISNEVIRTYLIAFGISFFFWGTIALIAAFARRAKKEVKK